MVDQVALWKLTSPPTFSQTHQTSARLIMCRAVSADFWFTNCSPNHLEPFSGWQDW
jgi:hypothetical protein